MIVFTNGCFDILHVGHVRLLERCRLLAGPSGHVIVGLNSDESVSRLKGPDRPINRQDHRREMLLALRSVDHVLIFHEDTPIDLIRQVKPDVIVKGGDYRPEEVVGHGICRIEIFDFVDGFSTTSLKENLGHR